MASRLRAAYEEMLAARAIRPDPGQAAAVEALARLEGDLASHGAGWFGRPRGQRGILPADRCRAIGAFEPAQCKMTLRDSLKMIHENDIDGGPAYRAQDRQCAGGDLVGHHEAEA